MLSSYPVGLVALTNRFHQPSVVVVLHPSGLRQLHDLQTFKPFSKVTEKASEFFSSSSN